MQPLIDLAIPSAISLFGAFLGVVVLRRTGGKIQGPGWSIDLPGPASKVLRERDGSRVFIEVSAAEIVSQRLADFEIEERTLLPSAAQRVDDYTATKLDSVMYTIDEQVICCLDLTEPGATCLAGAIGPITGNLRRRMVEDLLKPSFEQNGFYSYRQVSGGVVADTRDWTEFIAERKTSVRGYIRHYIRNKFLAPEVVAKVAASIEGGDLRKQIDDCVEELYDRYWHLWDQIHQQKTQIRQAKADYVLNVRNGILGG